MHVTGQTKDGRWQFGVRRTAPLDEAAAWNALVDLVARDPDAGEVRSTTAGSVARYPYRLPAWDEAATLQIRVLRSATGTTLAVHLDGLPSEAARNAMQERWTAALETLVA
jgi:hypothetical protein